MSDAWDDRKKAMEEEYFRRKDQEAIEKLRQERARAESEAVALRCPKCDGTLSEITFEDVQIDRCSSCNGVWLDAGELERLTDKEEETGWLSRLRRNFSDG